MSILIIFISAKYLYSNQSREIKNFKNQFPYFTDIGKHQPNFCMRSMRPQTH